MLLGLTLLLAAGAQAQTTTTPGQFGRSTTPAPRQSLSPTQGVCTVGSQSLRVCNSDFQSCNDVCAATAVDASADIAGCTSRCCTQFNVCLRMRGCGGRVISCN